ncbi:hypothetical protein KFE96_01715 [Kordiimonas sp. SCSIO 12603]|uniref:hypothetical protein n=1 Tax=Kordiimonas sp. SCSIO 12603 TaxID=2829596 RepID=UPI0021042EFF|nr:hypothetical protein [Kordiimonas sp. SCSIO 12603]UTW59050.1 hypothetical protein KFE96_01715 [Kordiimonas sp. SCSIO 12603]
MYLVQNDILNDEKIKSAQRIEALTIAEAILQQSFAIVRALCEKCPPTLDHTNSDWSDDFVFWNNLFPTEEETFDKIYGKKVEAGRAISQRKTSKFSGNFPKNLHTKLVKKYGSDWSESIESAFADTIDSIEQLHKIYRSLSQNKFLKDEKIPALVASLQEIHSDLCETEHKYIFPNIKTTLMGFGDLIHGALSEMQNTNGGFSRNFDENDKGSSFNTGEIGIALYTWEQLTNPTLSSHWNIDKAQHYIWENQDKRSLIWRSNRFKKATAHPYRTATVLRFLLLVNSNSTTELQKALSWKASDIDAYSHTEEIVNILNLRCLALLCAEAKRAGIHKKSYTDILHIASEIVERVEEFCKERPVVAHEYEKKQREKRLAAAYLLEVEAVGILPNSISIDKEYLLRLIHEPAGKKNYGILTLWDDKSEFRLWTSVFTVKARGYGSRALKLKALESLLELARNCVSHNGLVKPNRDHGAWNWAAAYLLEALAEGVSSI